MKAIQVFGPGCTKCGQLHDHVQVALSELNEEVPVEKITDPLKFAAAGVLVTPSLGIDGHIVTSGRVPSVEELKHLFREEEGRKEAPPLEEAPENKNCCGSGGCCSPKKPQGANWRKWVLWLLALLLLLAGVRWMNRHHKAAEKPPGAVEYTAEQKLPDRVEVVYYQFGARCATCQRMEKWAQEALQDGFSPELAAGTLEWLALPAGRAEVQAYELTTKSLIVKNVRNNTEGRWVNLENIWALNTEETAFKDYVKNAVREKMNQL